MNQHEIEKEIELNPREEELIESKEVQTSEAVPVTREQVHLISIVATRIKEIVSVVIMTIVLLVTIYGLVYNLIKSSNPSNHLEDSIKILETLQNLHPAHGAFAIPNIAPLLTNQTWNETSF